MSRPSFPVCSLTIITAVAVSTVGFSQDPGGRKSAAAANAQRRSTQWIWSPAHAKDHVPVGDCYFRKTFRLKAPQFGQVQICCDNRYELYVNGQKIAEGNDWRTMDVHNVTERLRKGVNVVAIKASNIDEGAAGLAATIVYQEAGSPHNRIVSDATWKTSVQPANRWWRVNFRDKDWVGARAFGPLGGTLPWGNEVVVAGEGKRFLIDRQFAVQRLVPDGETGSLIAFTFNGRGEVIASREGGGLLRIRDGDGDGLVDSVEPLSRDVRNVQGLLSLGSRLFAVGDGPQGAALYRLSDTNRDGRPDETVPLVRFGGSAGEHGAHAVALGPDGLLYITVGNHARLAQEPAITSPYGAVYEGDLVRPKYEDPRGHAVGVPAPGGTVIRTDTEGSFVEIVAGGLRNAYDIAFDAQGEMFTYDADMEWDIGTPWYRPTRICHLTMGAEFGWRSGWSKWPSYYLDSLPAALDMGPGSPTGVVFYEHDSYPAPYRHALFAADWAQGKIYVIRFQRAGATFRAQREVFLEGRPLNATDLEVGPDGALYFSTGGRGTEGGIWRVVHNDQRDRPPATATRGVERALQQPQIAADWSRREIAGIVAQNRDEWADSLYELVRDPRQLTQRRLRALELMRLFGPSPSPALLLALSRDEDPQVRAQAARLVSPPQARAAKQRLWELLRDSDPLVRRIACESLVGDPAGTPIEPLLSLLSDEDRYVRFAARRLLEKLPIKSWRSAVLASKYTPVFLNGAAALLIVEPSLANARPIVDRCVAMMAGQVEDPNYPRGFLTDGQFLDVLRVAQLALRRSELAGSDVPGLRNQLVLEFPSASPTMNRELLRLLVYLEAPETSAMIAQFLESDAPTAEKLHVAAYASRLRAGWTPDEKLAVLRFYESVRAIEGGYSLSAYIDQFARNFSTRLTLDERRLVIREGQQLPMVALAVLAKLPAQPGVQLLEEVQALDQRLESESDELFRRLRVGTVAVLGRSGDAQAHSYLRDVYRRQPQRRAPVAVSLSQHPTKDNWPILVDALTNAEGLAAQQILKSLAGVNLRPQDAEPYRQVILQGRKLASAGGALATQLLEHWTRHSHSARPTLDDELTAWQQWYSKEFPDALPAELPQEPAGSKWSFAELASYLESEPGKSGDRRRGAKVFVSAQCAKCHRFGGRGEAIGPDLTAVTRRFQTKEILESIVFPSHIISDQYASSVIVAGGAAYEGIVVPHGRETIAVIDAAGKKHRIRKTDIEEQSPSQKSSMPSGLLNPLSLEEVADLFAYLANDSSRSVARRNTTDANR